MSGIVGSRLNIRGSGLVGSLGTDGQVFTSAGAGKSAVFEAAGGGKLGQVVGQYGAVGTANIGSSSYVSLQDGTNYLEKSITPVATSSNVLVIVVVQGGMAGGEGFGVQILFDTANGRSGSEMGASVYDRNFDNQGSNSPVYAMGTWTFLHNPNTTNATNYHVKVKTVSANTVEFNGAGKPCITLMEILA
tara:strand:+ start:72 stop:641 length:570 start_codon:yes stop_codon:yes gene_type:complete